MEIQVNVINKRATVVGTPTIVCGNKDYTVRFIFDDEWASEQQKTARFVYTKGNEIEHVDVELDGAAVPVPVLADINEVRVGVFAGDKLTSMAATIPCERSIRCYATT
jgi:hypothetical protein